MRTTVTLDDDVSAALDRIQTQQRVTFRQALNELIREGLASRERGRDGEPASATTRSRDLGTPLVADFDRTSELIAVIEGETYR